MLLHEYLELFRQAIENVEDYGYAESIEINEEIRPNKQAVIYKIGLLLTLSMFNPVKLREDRCITHMYCYLIYFIKIW